jgi:hypothetical protein
MELAGAAKKMFDFDEALSLAQTSEDRVLGGEMRDLILDSYEELIVVMPQTFIIGEEEQQREGIIINSLHQADTRSGTRHLRKLYGADSLHSILSSSPKKRTWQQHRNTALALRAYLQQVPINIEKNWKERRAMWRNQVIDSRLRELVPRFATITRG